MKKTLLPAAAIAAFIVVLVANLVSPRPAAYPEFTVSPADAAGVSLWTTMKNDPSNAANGSTPGMMTPALFTKLNDLPTNATLASTYATQTMLANKSVFSLEWSATGSPAIAAQRYMVFGPPAAPVTTVRSSNVIVPFDVTCTAIAASYVEAVQATDTLTFCLSNASGVSTGLCTSLTPAATGPSIGTGSVVLTAGSVVSMGILQSGAAASTANTGTRVGIACKSP